jgi:hypothetical protein
METVRRPVVKKIYSPPALVRYGSLTEMTATTGSAMSAMDGGPNNTKTA